MGFWPRIVVTAVVTAAVFTGGWVGVEATGTGQGAAIAVASLAGIVVVTLGAAWVSRARQSGEPDPAGGTAVVSRSASGQAVGHAHGPVIGGPGSNFSGATIRYLTSTSRSRGRPGANGMNRARDTGRRRRLRARSDAQTGTGTSQRGSDPVVRPLQVIAAPRRLRILELVWDTELSAGQIAAKFDVSWSAVSQHLRVLKTAGFIVERREGTSRLYRADKAALGSLRAVVEDHWRQGLDRIKDLAETEQARADQASAEQASKDEA